MIHGPNFMVRLVLRNQEVSVQPQPNADASDMPDQSAHADGKSSGPRPELLDSGSAILAA